MPILLSSITTALTAALLVGWVLVILKNLELTRQYAQNTWLLVTGIVSFSLIIVVLVLFSVFLGREISEVHRQTSFIDSVTHELQSPLASLRLGLETLGRPQLVSEQRENLRHMMLDDVDRLSTLVRDILTASRLEQGSLVRLASPIDLASASQEAARAVIQRYKLDPSAIRVDIRADIQVVIDRGSLVLILNNLLDNAVKYSDPPVQVRMSVGEVTEKRITLHIQDRGIGIPKWAHKRVLDRFYRVPDEFVQKRHGTGLGLFVVSTLARNFGGKLQILANAPEPGTTISLTLLRAKAPAIHAKLPSPTES